MYFSLSDLPKYLPILLQGVNVAIYVTLVSMAAAFVQGLLLALGRLSGSRPLRAICTAWIEIVRGTPCLLQIYYVYYVGPSVGLTLSPILAGVAGLSINYGAYMSEVFRGAILSISSGQVEAGLSLGMARSQIMLRIILPQAIRKVIPPLGNFFVGLIKDSSLLSAITIREIMLLAYEQAALTFKFLEMFVFAAMIYFALSYPATLLVDWLERKLDVNKLVTKAPRGAMRPHLLSPGIRKSENL